MFSCNLRCLLIFLHGRSRTYRVASLRAGLVGRISYNLYFDCKHVRCVSFDFNKRIYIYVTSVISITTTATITTTTSPATTVCVYYFSRATMCECEIFLARRKLNGRGPIYLDIVLSNKVTILGFC